MKICRACDFPAVREIEITTKIKSGIGNTAMVVQCDNCGFVYNEKNTHAFVKPSDYWAGSDPKKYLRVGDGVRRGREYGMTKMAIDIIGIKKPSILIFGAGVSQDHDLLRSEGLDVWINDFVNIQKSKFFIELDSDRQFDIVICSEVIEHFEDPIADFKSLLKFVKDEGLCISGTNMSDGIDLAKLAYVWTPGHCSYWSGSAIRAVSRRLEVGFDIRATAMKTVSPRKRYIFQSRGFDMSRVAAWFGGHRYGWSEDSYMPKK